MATTYENIIVAWDRFEKANGGHEIIDFNLLLAETTDREYKNRYQILQDLTALKEGSEDAKFNHKLDAHICYLRALMGQQFSLEDYVEATQQIPVIFFDDQVLETARQNLGEVLDEVGLTLGPDLRKEMERLTPIIPPKDLDDYYRESYGRHKKYLEDALGKQVAFELKIEIVEDDGYWSCWVDGAGKTYRLRINTRGWEYSEARILAMVYHELLAHCSQVALWTDEIAAGRLHHGWGLTTVHTPEQFLMEGLAQTLPLYLQNEYTTRPEMISRIHLTYFTWLILNNIHIMINRGDNIESCIDYSKKHIPWYETDKLIPDLSSRTNNLLFRSYQYVYPASFHFFLKLTGELSDGQKIKFLQRCFYDVLLYKELKTRI